MGIVTSAIKAQHRLTEEDRSLGFRPRKGTPEGCALLRWQNPFTRRALAANSEQRA